MDNSSFATCNVCICAGVGQKETIAARYVKMRHQILCLAGYDAEVSQDVKTNVGS